MDYNIIKTPLFEYKFQKIIPLNKKEDARRRIENLKYNPYIGKPLGYKYFRELKLDKFRIYYAVFDKEVLVLMIDVSDKKTQKESIEFIKSHKEIFKEMIKNLNNK